MDKAVSWQFIHEDKFFQTATSHDQNNESTIFGWFYFPGIGNQKIDAHHSWRIWKSKDTKQTTLII